MFKKITIKTYSDFSATSTGGTLELTTTITLDKNISANDFDDAKNQVKRAIFTSVAKNKKYTVEWKRDGYFEGYMVNQ